MEKSVQESLTRQFHRIANLMQRNIRGGLHKDPDELMHRGQAMLLGILFEKDGESHKELVEKMNIRPSSLGELVDRLEQNGYVVRRPNEKDKRISNVFLTEDGWQTAQKYIRHRAELLNNVFSGLSGAEQAQLAYLLDKLTHSLEKKEEQNLIQRKDYPEEKPYDACEGKIHCANILQTQKR